MININVCRLSLSSLVLRYYLMMGVTIGLGFMEWWIPAAIVAFAFAISCILGISISFGRVAQRSVGKVIRIEPQKDMQEVG